MKQLAAPHTMTPKEQAEVDSYLNRQIIGALRYVAMYTKPEISYAVGVLSRHNETRTYASCKLANHLLRYLQGHSDCVIEFAESNIDLHCFSDAELRGDVLTRRSTTGYIVFAAGGPISYQSKLHTIWHCTLVYKNWFGSGGEKRAQV
jgi:hypothetical protein